ncbi:MAG: tRNA guanosine(34) transglycosylase Tgt [Patescibacteria group bacterium]
MDFSFQVVKKDKTKNARAGIINTPHGKIETPAFSPVATRATVKTLSVEDLKSTGSQVVLANTYHLYLRPGVETIKKFGGFAPFMKWDGPTITDSGGYQVSFLWQPKKVTQSLSDPVTQDVGGRVAKITDEGATFVSYIDGSRHLLTPEKSMEIQNALGADIIMAFDQPLANNDSPKKIKEAVKRTFMWEERSFSAWQKIQKVRITKGQTHQALYGILQGGTDIKLRREFLKFVINTGFPGVAMGGESIGSDPKATVKTLDTISDLWPQKLPVHALGLGGGPEGIFEAIERGVDTFDNTSITRMARAGLLFIYPEDGGNIQNKFRVEIQKSKFKTQKSPLSKVCTCYTCTNYSAAYVHHLIVSQEILGLRLTTIHNVHFINNLMFKIRNAILSNDFSALKKEWVSQK